MPVYLPTTWNEKAAPDLNAAQLNRMEAGIAQASVAPVVAPVRGVVVPWLAATLDPTSTSGTNMGLSLAALFGDTFVAAGDRVLVTQGGTKAGIWVYQGVGVAMTRPTDWPDPAVYPRGMLIPHVPNGGGSAGGRGLYLWEPDFGIATLVAGSGPWFLFGHAGSGSALLNGATNYSGNAGFRHEPRSVRFRGEVQFPNLVATTTTIFAMPQNMRPSERTALVIILGGTPGAQIKSLFSLANGNVVVGDIGAIGAGAVMHGMASLTFDTNY